MKRISLGWHCARWLCCLLVHRATSFGFEEHAKAVTEALARADKLRTECIAADAAHVASGADPLVAACDARSIFRQYLFALRHLLAFFSPSASAVNADHPEKNNKLADLSDPEVKRFLTRAGELDVELSQLVFAGRSDKYYFWHGPKRHVPWKFEELLNHEVGGRRVRDVFNDPPEDAPRPPMKVGELGLIYPTAAKQIDMADTAVLMNGAGDACAVGSAAAKAGIQHFIASGDEPIERLQPCLDKKLKLTYDVSTGFSDLFSGDSQTPLQDAVKDALAAAKRDYVDTLILPARAWTDSRLKGYISAVAKQLLKSGEVKQLGLAGMLPAKQLQKIVSGEPKPKLWLVQHDDCAPMTPQALEAAHKNGLKVIAFGGACGAVAEYVAKKESLSAAGLIGRWTAELGMILALPHSTVDFGSLAQEIEKGVALSKDSWRLLSGAAILSRTTSLATSPDFEDSFGIREVVARASDYAAEALQRNDTSQGTMQGALSKDVWDGLQKDREEFDDNYYIIYKKNFLSPERYQRVMDEAKRLWFSPDLEPNCNLDGTDRIGGYVLDDSSRDSSLYQLFYGSEEFRQWVSHMNGHMMFPSDFPIELREYPTGSKGMQCHRDLLMYTNATLDLEFVYTIDNFGTCVSTYQNRRGETTEVHTEANSLIMVRPNAAMHCVKPAEGGHRTILKFIYVGDYRKSSEFGQYTENECPKTNPNVRTVLERRGKAEL